MSDTSDQEMPMLDESSYSTFYTDDNEFCIQRDGIEICVNPAKIFTSTFKKINLLVEQTKKDNDNMTSYDDLLGNRYIILKAYFCNVALKKYIGKLDKSEWRFWFVHVITQLRKLQTSPQWKQDGKLGRNDIWMMAACYFIFQNSCGCKLCEKSFRVPKEFYYTLASCMDTLTPPRLPQKDFIPYLVGIFDCCETHKSTTWTMIEKSGLLVPFLRCSTMSFYDTEHAYSFYTHVESFYTKLTSQFHLIGKHFKAGQPCGDIVRKILAGKDGHSNPDPNVLNFLQTLLKLADLVVDMCKFCKITKSEQWLFCSDCQNTSYCSKECQRNHWKSHKLHCAPSPPSVKKNLDALYKILNRFLIDHRDAISLKIQETGHNIEELVLTLDFDTNFPDWDAEECGVAPALSDPPQFEIFSDKNADEYLETNYPYHKDDILKSIKSSRENLKEEGIICLCNDSYMHKFIVSTDCDF